MDAEYPGELEGKRAMTHLDVLETFGPSIRASAGKTKLFFNGDISAEEGNRLVAEKKIDAIVLGRSFINNPEYALSSAVCVGADHKAFKLGKQAVQ